VGRVDTEELDISDMTTGVLDTLGMFKATAGFPEQVAAAVRTARGLDGLPEREYVENVVVLGMGGSGIVGDVMTAVAGPFLPVPVVVVKSYDRPDFIGPGSLVFAVSFSGNTEETVEAAGEAANAGASLVAVTGGGQLSKLAEEWGAPVVQLPGDIPQPRAALGAMAVPPLVILEEIGLFPGAAQWVAQAVDQLTRRRDALVRPGSLAEELAGRIGRTIPLVYGAHALGATAALRWKTQVNENAKSPAFCGVYPELCHNEVAGWGQHGDATRQLITVVNLRHDVEHPQVVRRVAFVSELLRESVADVIEVSAEGEGDLAQLLDLILVGDFVSLHMAAREGIDPGPVPVLDDLKRRLAEA
jgi:glucose/mannose-6-phosphate isomerase